MHNYGLYEETQAKLKGPVQYDDKIVRKTTSKPYFENYQMTDKRVRTEERVQICCLYDTDKQQFRHFEVGVRDPDKNSLIKAWIKANVEEGAIVFSDATTLLNDFIGYYNIMRVKHWRGEFARDTKTKILFRGSEVIFKEKVSNNRVEGFGRKFLEQNAATFQHRSSMKNISYYVRDTLKRFGWDGALRNGMAVGLDSMVTAARYYRSAAVATLRKNYAPQDYFYSAALVPG